MPRGDVVEARSRAREQRSEEGDRGHAERERVQHHEPVPRVDRGHRGALAGLVQQRRGVRITAFGVPAVPEVR